jgi:exonuclease V
MADSDIIDVKSFEYDETFMEKTVKHSLEFWHGQRPLEGVSIGDTWKCNVCEYKADCEWRQEQAAILSQRKRA